MRTFGTMPAGAAPVNGRAIPETRLTPGRTVGEAFMWMYRAERACYMQLSVQQAGVEINPISEEVQLTTIERNRFNNSEKGYRPIGKVEWPALRRKLDRIDPSYKD